MESSCARRRPTKEPVIANTAARGRRPEFRRFDHGGARQGAGCPGAARHNLDAIDMALAKMADSMDVVESRSLPRISSRPSARRQDYCQIEKGSVARAGSKRPRMPRSSSPRMRRL